MKLFTPFLAVWAASALVSSAQTYWQDSFESDAPGSAPAGAYTVSPSSRTTTNGAMVVAAETSPANPGPGNALYLYDLSGDLTSGDPTHLRADFNGGTNVSNVRVDFDFRRGFAAIDPADEDTRFHFAVARSGDSLNNSDFRPFELRILNRGDLVVNSIAGSATVATHQTDAINHVTLLINSHDTNSVTFSDPALGNELIAPNTFVVYLNHASVGTFAFHQTPDPTNAPQIDFLAENNDLGQFAFYQDSRRQGELLVDNISITAITEPVTTVAAPTGLAGTASDAFTVDLNWTDQADNEGYYIVRRQEGDGTNWIIAELPANSTSYTDTGVEESTTYNYTVQAGAAMIMSDASNVAVISTPAQVGPVIRSVTAPDFVLSGETAIVTVSTAGAAPLSYQWYRGVTGDTARPIAGATSRTLSLPGFTASANVWLRVSNASGAVDSDTVALTVQTPGTTIVTTEAQLNAAIAAAGAGDTILLADGTWNDVVIRFSGVGTATAPITVGAVTPGSVIMRGASRAQVGGDYLILRDLIFSGPYSGNDDEVIQFRNSGTMAEHCRVTNVALINYVPAAGTDTDWVSFYGRHNRLDHCYFKGHDVPGVTVVVWLDGSPNDHRIDHNHFDERASGGGANGWETIRIGTSDYSLSSSRTIVEHNLFSRQDGEIEIISNKSGDNIYRYNTFLDCAGTLTLRHGDRCRVDSNYFLGRGRSGSGGVRVIGTDHVIVNNHFEGTAARDGAAITIYAGVSSGALNEYYAAHRALVAHNTFVNNNGLAIHVGTGFGSRNRTVLPTDVTLANNLVTRPGSASNSLFGGDAVADQTWTHNLYQGGTVGSAPAAGFTAFDPQFKFDALRLLSLPTASTPAPALAEVTLDIEGRTRGAMSDIGAHELSSTVAAVVTGAATTLTTGPSYLAASRTVGTPNARLVNSSVRAVSESGAAILINGFVIGGNDLKSVLVRTIGPGLATYGVDGFMPQPSVVVFNAAGTELDRNAGWDQDDGGADLARASAAVGAFALEAGVADSAVIATLSPGAYTAQVQPVDGTGGTVLVEVYDLTPGSSSLTNQSARGEVRAGQEVLIAGFVVDGTAPRRALVRCVGPGLAGFGVADAIDDLTLRVFDRAGEVVIDNDNWSSAGNAAAIASAASAVGAFALEEGSADAAALLTLPPGPYTVHTSGVGGDTGTALIEIYFLEN
ncbi:chondroitinase-B domain-containing protein [Synoicihabitans lomoniglobus]|uniref:Chondroitinase-B domain-containing protein n=1 Tax=Synoicihabitans lomoniglobus TaxID=2909285 RepID=A0AAF0CGT8_9BACT|nr:hypothetical protein [Opitutaceae bacterium LMO-M01]WED63722.1 chondroitinase-B domain-containing protein [Opitutaceae bacterium LMO-M01]